ncbi:uncharacterized protein LOC143368571 isoform X2 [Andrena cerasifolii]|uniref:uncharacterized protein LOC143368571 isoform X2 n=1 Tax=Andrena cerasifolii TaxID=2819439 RepID=UPI004037830C
MAAPQASSRLELLQARFQQKQLQEKEQKLLQLYDQQQQRAYQVVQRGSAGSNGSSHGSSISQHTVTRTSTSSHATSTSQGGKVRQMFDERRQTTVKGIDRSYPLEPLENKPRKQTNGNGAQRNGNLTVNRQSVTVKRVARSDVNSNLNGGKPVVSYHEEVTRESFGPSGEQHTDDDEFGNENHVAQYSNGNHRDETRGREVLNEDTIQRNRMMAKLHLMEYDETLKHRVKNDLESVQFPDDFMVDVPDKLPKQSGAKKVSQAEVRLERFKNANARRSNSITKNSSTISGPKKRSDPAFPAKPTSRGNEAVKNRTRKVLQKGLDTRKKSPQRGETMMSDSERNPRRRSDSPKFFCKESGKSATTYAIDSKAAGKLSPDFSEDRGRRSASPKFFCKESEKSATTYAIDSKAAGKLSPGFSENRGRRSASPKFFCKESEKSATTYAIDAKTAGKFSPDFSKGVKRTVVKIEPRGARATFTELRQNIRKKSDKSAATMGTDTVDRHLKSGRTSSPESIKNEMLIHKKVQDKINTKPVRSGSPNVFDRLTKERSASPRFLDRESEKPAAKMHHGAKFTSKSPERTEKIAQNRSDSPRVVSRKREASSIHAPKSKSPDSTKRILRKANTSPQFFLTDSNRSSTIMLVTPETITKPRTDSAKSKKKTGTPGPSMNKSDVTLSSRIAESSRRVSEEDAKESSKYNIRSSVSRFFSEQCERASRNAGAGTGDSILSAETGRSTDLSRGSSPVSLKDMKTPGLAKRTVQLSSPRSQNIVDSKNGPAEFFCYETERSATTVKPKSPKHSINERSKNPRTKSSNSANVQSMNVKCKSSKTSGNFTVAKDTEVTAGVGKSSSRGSSPGSMKMGDSRSGTPEFFCYESDKSATTVSFKPKSRKDSKGSEGPPSRPTSSTSVHPPGGSPKSPVSFNLPEDVEIIPNIRRNISREPSRGSQKIVDTRSGTPEFFCYESEKSATTVSLKPKSTKDSTNSRPKSPPSRPTSSTSVQAPGRSSKSPDFSPPEDSEAAARRGSNNVLRSTRLIRDIINRQKGGSRSDYASARVAKESRRNAFESAGGSIRRVELKHGSKVDEAEELRAHRSVDKRATTPTTPALELLAPESTPKSSTRVDVGTQEITMHDQYIKQERLQRGQLRSTYSKSLGKAPRDSRKKSSTENLFTYPVRKSGKKRVSLFESSIFEPPRKDRQATDRVLGSRRTTGSSRVAEETAIGAKGNASSTERSCSSSPSSTNKSVSSSLKRGLREITTGQGNGAKAPRSGRKTASPIFGESKKQRRSPTPHKQAEILRSIELVRRIVKGSQFERNEARGEVCKTVASNVVAEKRETRNTSESETEGKKSESIASATGSISFASKDYERTDSVESALRRFDSIGTEAGVVSARSTSGRSEDRGSMTEKRRAEVESRGVAGSADDSRAISLKALDQADVNVPPSPENKLSRGTSKKASTAAETAAASPGASRTQETGGRKKLAKARDSIEIARITARSKSPACRRKLFPDLGSTQGTKTGGTRSGCSLESMRTTEHLSPRKKGRKSETADPARAATRFVKHVKRADKGKEGKAPTGASGSNRSVLVKRLRSIEDIRKSIGSKSCRRRATEASSSLKSAIASDASRCSSPVQRRASSEDRVGNRKGLSLSKRSESLSGRSEASGDSERSVKCATRSFRVTKSPSPDSTKATEISGRPRRNVPSSPSKSPDTVTRRPSTDFKVQDTKPSKRPVPMKGTEPIGNRKTATTSTATSTRKSTDVVDGAILENGLHLRDQTAETKYDNDSPTTKKSDAFVIEFDEQPSKENDGPPKKPLLRKQSTEKQTPPAQSGRPPSSVSSTSNGSSMQASVTRGKMASRARTPISGTASSKGSASSKGGAGLCAADSLVPCKMCGRRFAQDRVGLHEQICAKTGQKKRKQFDAMIYRVKGTELEPFLRRASCKKPEKSKKPEVKTNWRRKHEDFINTIRSAKQVQAHLAAGGKLSDLPPPPASDTSDYIQCPHCGRKFNQCAAERHIPKCEHMLHNKPVHLRAPKPKR